MYTARHRIKDEHFINVRCYCTNIVFPKNIAFHYFLVEEYILKPYWKLTKGTAFISNERTFPAYSSTCVPGKHN